MKQQIISVLTIVLCVSIMAFSSMTAMAVTSDDSSVESEVTSSAVSSTEKNAEDDTDSAIDTDTSAVTDSEDSSDVTSSEDSSDVTSSEDSSDVISSENDFESAESDSSDETSSTETTSDETSSSDATSSNNTTSRKPITSVGSGGGSTFIDENGSRVSNSSSAVLSVPGTLLDTEQVEDEEDEDMDHFAGQTTTAAMMVYKIIWIPIVLALLCIGGLVYVNVFLKKQYGISGKPAKKSTATKSKANRRK